MNLPVSDESKVPRSNGWKKQAIIDWLTDKDPTLKEEDLDDLIIPELVKAAKKFQVSKDYKVRDR